MGRPVTYRRHKACLKFVCPNCGAPPQCRCDRDHRPDGYLINQRNVKWKTSSVPCPERLALVPRPLPATQLELPFLDDKPKRRKGGD